MHSCRQFFEPHEDELLRAVVAKLGTEDWRQVAAHMPGRTARQCRERYTAYLCPNINHGAWTAEEDEILLAKFPRFGSRWAEYRPFFRHRTLASIRNRWYVLQRRREHCAKRGRRDRRAPAAPPPFPRPDPLAVFDIANLLNPPCDW
jgi:hypothetical protein